MCCDIHYELQHTEAKNAKGEMSDEVTFVVFESTKEKPWHSLTSPQLNCTRSQASVPIITRYLDIHRSTVYRKQERGRVMSQRF